MCGRPALPASTTRRSVGLGEGRIEDKDKDREKDVDVDNEVDNDVDMDKVIDKYNDQDKEHGCTCSPPP